MPGRLSVNPNRMELLKLRRRLAIARRGHKLLKDKFDELMKPFLAMIKDTRDLRTEVEHELLDAHRLFALASSATSTKELEEALSIPRASAEVLVSKTNIVSVSVPSFELDMEGDFDCYGLALTPAILDVALGRFRGLLSRMIKLAQEEHALRALAWEIEKTRPYATSR
jgi:V/A-type H+-transporting ATPase subunit D